MARYTQTINSLTSSRTDINQALSEKLEDTVDVKFSEMADKIREIETVQKIKAGISIGIEYNYDGLKVRLTGPKGYDQTIIQSKLHYFHMEDKDLENLFSGVNTADLNIRPMASGSYGCAWFAAPYAGTYNYEITSDYVSNEKTTGSIEVAESKIYKIDTNFG